MQKKVKNHWNKTSLESFWEFATVV